MKLIRRSVVRFGETWEDESASAIPDRFGDLDVAELVEHPVA